MPFRVKNGSTIFQQSLGDFVVKHKLKYLSVYLQNIAAAGKDQEEHDGNPSSLRKALFFFQDGCESNEEKSIFPILLIQKVG